MKGTLGRRSDNTLRTTTNSLILKSIKINSYSTSLFGVFSVNSSLQQINSIKNAKSSFLCLKSQQKRKDVNKNFIFLCKNISKNLP